MTLSIRTGCYAHVILAAAFLQAPVVACAQPGPNVLRASVLVGTDYIQHGLSQNQHAPALRVAFDFEHKSGVFLGGSLGNVEYDAESRFRTPRDKELTLYVGYLWQRNQWMTNVAASRYAYPGIERNYDYTEFSVSTSYRDRYFLSLSRGDEYLSIFERSTRVRTGFALPWIWDLEFGVNVGRSRFEGSRDISYNHWDIGFSRPMGRFALDLRFHDSDYGRSSLIGNDTDDQWVVSMTYAFLPRR